MNEVFPDLALPDHTGRPRTLSEVAGGDPLVALFSRGWWCPKEQRYLRNLVPLQDEFEVAYSKLVVVSVDPPEVQSAFRAGLGARFHFLSDHERRYLDELGLRETTDTVHDPYRPAAFALYPDLRVHARLQRLLVLGPPDARGDPPRHARHLDGDPQRLGAPLTQGSSRLLWDGVTLTRELGARRAATSAPTRAASWASRVRAWAHVCALADEDARLPYDTPEVQGVRRDALAWWIPLLGDALVCLTTLAVDTVNYGGAVTVATSTLRCSTRTRSRGSSRAAWSRRSCSAAFRRRPDRWSSATAASPGPAVASDGRLRDGRGG